MFSEAFTDLSHSFPISGSKYWFENGRDITPLIKLQFFFYTLLQMEITNFPSTALLCYPERCFHTYVRGELKLVELYFWYIIIMPFIEQKGRFHSIFYRNLKSGSSKYVWLPCHFDKVLPWKLVETKNFRTFKDQSPKTFWMKFCLQSDKIWDFMQLEV